jgi:hypothetical protein
VFQKYQAVGLDVNDSQGFDLMRMKGVLSLASDMGVKGMQRRDCGVRIICLLFIMIIIVIIIIIIIVFV